MAPVSAVDALLAHEFPLRPDLLYLNHAAVAPWPRRTAEAVARFAEENMRQGAFAYPDWLQTERRVRAQAAELIRAHSADDVALLKNTSEALSVVAYGFPWRSGDNVVISAEEFPSNRIVWESLKPRGVEVREVALAPGDPEARLLAAFDARTRLLSISSVQYASGLRLDLERLGSACRAKRIAFCVDAIQSLGALSHDVQACAIDFLMADAHKWLLGPEGIALFYCAPDWRERLALHQYGWHMVEHAGDFDRRNWVPAASARRFECGSPNMLGIHALSASLSLFSEIGMADMERRVLERTRFLCEAIRQRPDLELITTCSKGTYAGIVSFRSRDTTSATLYERLCRENVVCALRAGAVRFSPHAYTPMDHIERALELTRNR